MPNLSRKWAACAALLAFLLTSLFLHDGMLARNTWKLDLEFKLFLLVLLLAANWAERGVCHLLLV